MPGVDWRAILPTAFDAEFESALRQGFRRKLGLIRSDGVASDAEDDALFESLLDVMEATGADFTNTFRALMHLDAGDTVAADAQAAGINRVLEALLPSLASARDLATAIEPGVPEDRVRALLALAPMDPRLNPHIPLLKREEGLWKRYRIVKDQSDEAKAATDRAAWEPWLHRFAARVGLEVAAASGVSLDSLQSERREVMRAANPRFVLRNYLAQIAIRAAENGDFGEVQRLLARVTDPYGEHESSPAELSELAQQLQRDGKVRGGNLVEWTDEATSAAASSASALAGAAARCSPDVAGYELPTSWVGRGTHRVAVRYDQPPPSWACKLRVSCSS